MVIWRRISLKALQRLLYGVRPGLRWRWACQEALLVLVSPRGRPWLMRWRRKRPGWFMAPLEEART